MLQGPQGFHRVKVVDKIYINLPLKCRFLVALMQKKVGFIARGM